ncbi:hypothetical protein [Dactylosporangium sp. CA-092794]|uniref:hypothetical protein n=1 Tax=Dactylosporangium sp. CA-092794 TaxID=3239929 RepID=UPI003D8FEABC
MIVVLPGRVRSGPAWRLICRGDGRADLLAYVPQPGGWKRAVECIRDTAGTLSVVCGEDGQYGWILTDEHGDLVAASPAVYRDAEGCRRAFSDARRAAGTVVAP